MLDYTTLLHADFSDLHEAVTEWRKLPEKFRKVHKQYENTVEKDLEGSDWKGDAATAALKKATLVGNQIDAAADEADDICKLLDSAHEIFTSSQSKLKSLKHDIESDKYLSIKPDGEVYFNPPKDTPTEDLPWLNKSYQETLQAYRSSIQSAIATAQDADDTLSWALSQDHNGRGKGFNSNTYSSIADAKKGREQAGKDLKELEKLTGKGSKLALASSTDRLDPETLRRINTLLSRHEGDPYFAEKFTTQLGAKGTLELWTRIADRRQTGDAQTKASADIQKSLSFTLATATHSHSHAMNEWKKQIISLGGTQVEYPDRGSVLPYKGPYGFQIMSSLMRYGSYDDKFLTDYGHGLIGFEKEHKHEKPADLWRAEGDEYPYLNFGSGDDYGQDPMAGYMEALGHNPHAAKDLFYSEDWAKGGHKVNQDLKYLLVDRSWPNANTTADGSRGYGYDELGHALEAATLGAPYDQAGNGIHRDNVSANIMGQVVWQVGQDPQFIKNRPGIGDSLGLMGSAYIDDLNWSLSNFGDHPEFQDLSNIAFNHHGPGHIDFAHQTSLNFLNAVGRDKVAYDILSGAQQEFTISALKAHPHPDDALSTVLTTGTKFSGALDQACVTGINDTYSQKSDDYSDALSDAAEWKKFGVSQTISTGVSIATLPVESAGRVVSFVVPSLAEGIGGAIETHESIAIDREVRQQVDDYNDKLDMQEIKKKSDFMRLAQNRATSPLSVYLATHPELKGSSWYQSVSRDMQTAYTNGSELADMTDSD
ncbi:hypothetical protein [Streptomyces sp. NPDC127190]|uniref:hypothetical protein n=1 Tax=unclassified Streptomyces TaxID=2593676 RepID=UPI00362809C4